MAKQILFPKAILKISIFIVLCQIFIRTLDKIFIKDTSDELYAAMTIFFTIFYIFYQIVRSFDGPKEEGKGFIEFIKNL